MGEQNETENERAQRLMQHIALGNESALSEFYRIFEMRVYAFAVRRLNDPHDAADILNTVMLEVWRTATRFEGRSAVNTWVLGITYRKIGDRLRQRGRRDMDELNPAMPDETTPTADEVLAQAQEAEQLRRCVEGLSDTHRQVVHLLFYEELPCQEIAKIVNCPEGTVKSRIFHAKRALKRCLGERKKG